MGTRTQQRQGWGWAQWPIPTKGSFFFVNTSIYVLTPTLFSPAIPPPPPSTLPPNTKNASCRTRFSCLGGSLPPHPPAREENTSCFGTHFHLWLHSIYQNTTNVPILAHWWCQQTLHPSLQPETKTHPIWGRVFISGYIPSTRHH